MTSEHLDRLTGATISGNIVEIYQQSVLDESGVYNEFPPGAPYFIEHEGDRMFYINGVSNSNFLTNKIIGTNAVGFGLLQHTTFSAGGIDLPPEWFEDYDPPGPLGGSNNNLFSGNNLGGFTLPTVEGDPAGATYLFGGMYYGGFGQFPSKSNEVRGYTGGLELVADFTDDPATEEYDGLNILSGVKRFPNHGNTLGPKGDRLGQWRQEAMKQKGLHMVALNKYAMSVGRKLGQKYQQ
jgi:hypothetical protein